LSGFEVGTAGKILQWGRENLANSKARGDNGKSLFVNSSFKQCGLLNCIVFL